MVYTNDRAADVHSSKGRRRKRSRRLRWPLKLFCMCLVLSAVVLTIRTVRSFSAPMSALEPAEQLTEQHPESSLQEPDALPPVELNPAPQSGAVTPDDWQILLVNRWNPLPDGYTFERTKLKYGHSVDSRAYPDLQEMMDDCRAAGLDPVICSSYRTQASYASILTGGSVEAVNTANNHSHDYGDQSFDDTLAALDDAGIVHFGYDETAVMDVKGVKVGLVGIYELYDHLEREQQLKNNIAKVKADGAQLIVVIFHWGNETETVPDSNQTTLGRIAIDEGADLVCGHHPHVLQGIETYKGRNIVYSLGNFCFGGNSSPSDMDTMIYQQTFTIDADGVKKDNVTNIIPCSISSAAYDGYNNYQPTPAEGDEATRILGKINERSSWISTAEGSTFTAKYNNNNDSQSSSADTAASDSDIVDMNSSASDDTDAETYDESYDTDNSDAE